MRRARILVTASVALAGCGGGEDPASFDDARACLEDEHLRVVAAGNRSGDAGAPDWAVIVNGSRTSAFLASYDTEARAIRYERNLQGSATAPGAVERRGRITFLWVRGRETPEGDRIKACVT